MDGKLYLLTEAAELTGITVEALRQRIKRRKFQGVRGNDGRLRVRLSSAEIGTLAATGRGSTGPVITTEPPTEQPANHAMTVLTNRPVATDASEARHLAEIGRLQAQHTAEIGRLIDQVTAERGLWLERIDAAEIRAEKVEAKLDMILNELLADRRRPWWARWRR